MPRLPLPPLLPLIAAVTACSPPLQDTAMPSTDARSPAAATIDTTPAAAVSTDAQAVGRRTLSTAFVRVGPDGYLTIEEHGGRTLVLRDVTMGKHDYCGIQTLPDGTTTKLCAAYGDVAAARAGGDPTHAR